MTVSTYQRRATEAQMQQGIKDLVERLGGRCWHVRDSRSFDVEDMPDLLIVLPPYVVLLEIKSQRRDVTPGQAGVIALLGQCNRVLSGIVRPAPRQGEMSYDECLLLLQGSEVLR